MKSTIRRGSKADLSAIHQWLVREDQEGIPGNFLCNWIQIENWQRDRKLWVCLDRHGAPVGFRAGDLLSPGILQVRADMRWHGIGSRLVSKLVRRHEKEDKGILYIQCEPRESIPFWLKMGFTVLEPDAHGHVYAYRVLPKKHTLPADGQPATVVVISYPEEKKWKADAAPVTCDFPDARICNDGKVVHLAERVYIFPGQPAYEGRDVVVEIRVNGAQVYCDKAKYEKAEALGVHRCKNGFFIDAVNLSAIP